MPRPSPDKRPRDRDEAEGASERLQKVLAAAGVGSRRDCEELITEGRVEVDGVVVSELGSKVDPMTQEIRVDGTALHRPKKLYFAVNKPIGVVSTNYDPSGRTRIIDLVPTEERVFPIGRLDRGSEGLILVTNDGELANRITHPRYGVEKTYHVRIAGTPTPEDLLKLKKGVHLAEGVARAASVRVRKSMKQCTDLEIILNEGKNREIRRVLAKLGHKVLWLKRLAVGPIRLAELPTGACRRLMPHEIDALLHLTKPKGRGERKPEGAKPASATSPKAEAPRTASKPDQKSAPTKSNERNAERGPTTPPRAPAIVARPGSPAKVDLAALLKPGGTIPVAKMVSPPPEPIGPVKKSIGDVLAIDSTSDGDVPGFRADRVRKPRRLTPEQRDTIAPPPFMLEPKVEKIEPHPEGMIIQKRPGKPRDRDFGNRGLGNRGPGKSSGKKGGPRGKKRR